MEGLRLLCAQVVLAAASASAWAQDEIVLGTTVHKVEYFTSERGGRDSRLVEAARVIPGDELLYTITFENVSEDVLVDAGSVVITNPIPPEVLYLEGTASGADTTISFSIDDGGVFGRPDQLRLTDEAGQARVAAASEYTHIRWVFAPALEPGQRGSVSFRARLR